MTRYKVLSILLKETDHISGEIISSRLGISRAAVNTAVKALRREGYEIESSTNRGYLLTVCPNRLNEGEIGAFLFDERMEHVRCLQSVDSTNDYLRAMAYEGAPEGQIVVADQQTRGKGRQGRSFESPAGNGIYLSVLLRPETTPENTAAITAWTAVAVSRAIQKTCGFAPDIKWINDLMMDERKLCGILTELAVEAESGRVQFLIIGIGINVNETSEDFSPEIRQLATSLKLETGTEVSRGKLTANLILELDRMIREWPEKQEEYLHEYRGRCTTPGNRIRILSYKGEEEGFAEAVDPSFGLVVTMTDGTKRLLNSGEVSTRRS